MKKHITRSLLIIGYILIGLFILYSIYDCFMYLISYQYLSSPLWLYVLVRIVTLLIPALFLLKTAKLFTHLKQFN